MRRADDVTQARNQATDSPRLLKTKGHLAVRGDRETTRRFLFQKRTRMIDERRKMTRKRQAYWSPSARRSEQPDSVPYARCHLREAQKEALPGEEFHEHSSQVVLW